MNKLLVLLLFMGCAQSPLYKAGTCFPDINYVLEIKEVKTSNYVVGEHVLGLMFKATVPFKKVEDLVNNDELKASKCSDILGESYDITPIIHRRN